MGDPNKRIAFSLPKIDLTPAARLLVVLPHADYPLDEISAVFSAQELIFVTPFADTFAALEAKGYHGHKSIDDVKGPIEAALLVLPRVKDSAQDFVAKIVDLLLQGEHQGLLVVDGHKNDGVDAMAKSLQNLGQKLSSISKDHGKVLSFRPDGPIQWHRPAFLEHADGWVTTVGVFSADGPDLGSLILREELPLKFGKKVLDLGAGWGFLSRAIVERDDKSHVTLVEMDHRALTAARQNLAAFAERTSYVWADVNAWPGDSDLFDTVVMNPPFHQGRATHISLGQQFIARAAQNLKPHGELWMVANRHLPYEKVMQERFKNVTIKSQRQGFKVFHAKGIKKRVR